MSNDSFKVAGNDALIHSFVYSAWDNVVGPKVLKTWPSSSFEDPSTADVVDEVGTEILEEREVAADLDCTSPEAEDQIARYISSHTLTGHLTKAKHTNFDSVNEVCLSVPSLGFASQSTTFYCLFLPSSSDLGDLDTFCTDEPCMSSLTVIFHSSHLKEFWDLQPLILHHLKKTSDRIKVGLSQDLTYFKDPIVSKWLQEIYRVLTETSRLHIHRSLVSSPIPVKKMLNNPQVPWDVVITSMLSTLGSCCVVGKNEDYVNRVIDLLAFFLPDKRQTNCSRYAADRFSGGLYLQGLLEDANGIRNINSVEILLNEFPLTLLDLTRKGRVRFSGHVHEHFRSRQRQSREQEFNIIQGFEPDIPFTTESVFRSFGESSRYVRWCLDQLATHNAEHWSRIISAFQQALALQALDVVKAFQAKSSSPLNADRLKAIKTQLKKSMKMSETDFWLLVATAERFKPGFSQLFSNYKIN